MNTKYVKIAVLTLIGFFTAQCGEDDIDTHTKKPRPDWTSVAQDVTERPNWVTDDVTMSSKPYWLPEIKGNDAAPQWKIPNMNIYSTSMTAIIRLTPVLEEFFDSADKMAAFIGDECRGVADIVTVNGINYFFILIKGESSENGNVVFKYYSKSQSRIYSSEGTSVKFESNKIYGTADNPEYPDFEQSGPFPYSSYVTVTLDNSNLPFTPKDNDDIAAFSGSECRSLLKIKNNGNNTYALHVLGRTAADEFKFKYYSADKKTVFVSNEVYTIESFAGTQSNPIKVTFEPDGAMTVICALDNNLSAYVHDDDILAAFSGGKCVGIAENMANVKDKSLYKLVIKNVVTDGAEIELKYYSSLGYIFGSTEKLIFDAGSVSGTINSPLSLGFDTASQCPLTMYAYIALEPELAQYASDKDLMAAFAGDECRGIAKTVTLPNGKIGFVIPVKGKLTNDETITLKYYSAARQYVYRSAFQFTFNAQTAFGAENTHREVKFIIED